MAPAKSGDIFVSEWQDFKMGINIFWWNILFLMPNISTTVKDCHQEHCTVWPQPIWKKVRTWWQIPPQHQSTYLGGPESASIEIPPFGPFLWCKFPKIKIFKNFRIAPNFFFALQYIKNWTEVVPWTIFILFLKKKLLVW